jgi:hypothetical protein
MVTEDMGSFGQIDCVARTRPWRAVAGVAAAAMLLAACGSTNEPAGDEEEAAPASVDEDDIGGEVVVEDVAPVEEPIPRAEEPTVGSVGRSYEDGSEPPELAGIIGLATADLAARLSVEATDIAVVLVVEVVWPDASLGCPVAGMSYAAVTTDGLRMVLESGGVHYDYRSGGSSDPVLCEPIAETSAGSPPTSVKASSADEGPSLDVSVDDDGEIVVEVIPPTEPTLSLPTEGFDPPDE